MYIESVPNRNSPPAALLRETYCQNGRTDGLHLVRRSLSEATFGDVDTVRSYKSPALAERAFRRIKTVDLHVRRLYHRLTDRLRHDGTYPPFLHIRIEADELATVRGVALTPENGLGGRRHRAADVRSSGRCCDAAAVTGRPERMAGRRTGLAGAAGRRRAGTGRWRRGHGAEVRLQPGADGRECVRRVPGSRRRTPRRR